MGGISGAGRLDSVAAIAAAAAARRYSQPVPAGMMSGRVGRVGQMAHLALLDRDFGEADYEMLLQLDEVDDHEKKRTLRANSKALDALPFRKVSKAEAKGSDGVCVICLEKFADARSAQSVCTLRCKHEYHRSCIMKWLKSCETPTCPTCKAPVLGGADESLQPPPSEGSPEQQWWHT